VSVEDNFSNVNEDGDSRPIIEMQGILEGFRVDFCPLCLEIQADMKLGKVGFPSF